MPASLKILIAEDDPISKRVLTKSLQDLGYDVIHASDGRAAFELFRSDPTPIVISDWMMPGRDGISLCQDIRGLNRTEYTHFILLTARVDRESYRHAMSAGVDDFLTKPLNREELAIRLRVSERVVLQRRTAEAKIRTLAKFPEENHNPVLQVTREGALLYANQASGPLLAEWGCRPNDPVPAVLTEILKISPADRPRNECEVQSGAREYSFTATSIDPEGTAYLYGHDITARKQTERTMLELKQKAEHIALHDGLTGLPNRLLLSDRLEQGLNHARRYSSHLALLMIDLDNFKTINDTLGHASGDRVLRLLAQTLKETLRETDTACRWGGDEFAVVLTELPSTHNLPALCERLRTTFTQASVEAQLGIPVSLSIGYAVFPEDAAQAEPLLQRADEALYQAKAAGRDCWCAYTEEARSGSKSELLARLTGAIDRKEILLYYHPIVDARSGLPVGLEALARWPDPTRGWVPPDTFIPMAEEKGLIRRLGKDLSQLGLQELRRLHDLGANVTLSLNLARAQLTDIDFAATMIQAMQTHRLPMSSVILEVTERQSLFESDTIRQTLESLASAGFRLSLDDFGSGYSSLDLIGAIPFQELKIHRGLICQVENSRARRLVQAVVEMAKALGLVTVAEGVETETILGILRDIGVNKIQGFLFARPMPPEETRAYLSRINWSELPKNLERNVAPRIEGGFIGF